MCCSLCSICHSHLTIFWCFSTNVLQDYYSIAKKVHSCFSCSLCNSHLNLSNVFYAHFVISIWLCLDALRMLLVNLALVISCVALYMMFVNCALVFSSCVVIRVLLINHALIFFICCFSCVIGQLCCDAFHMFYCVLLVDHILMCFECCWLTMFSCSCVVFFIWLWSIIL
jgi:hypothetical protein